MKSLGNFIKVVGVVVKYSAIAMVVIKTIQYFHDELGKLNLDKETEMKNDDNK